MKLKWFWWMAAVVLFVGVGFALSQPAKPASQHELQVVAAENFWGSLAAQLGGDKVHVTTVISDPNADPHEYASTTKTARAFAAADYVVLNGAGYDAWGDKLLSADLNPHRRVLTVATMLGKQNGDNPHFWYNPSYVNRAVVQMDDDLIALQPSQKAYFAQRLSALQVSLASYQNEIAHIRQQFGGVPVASTEDIFAYMADAAGLNLISPPAFTQAVAEGNDPPAASVATFQQQLQRGQPRVLVFNAQTVTPLTNSVKKLAEERHVPVVGITETMPANSTFQDWMRGELVQLEEALRAK